MKFLRFRTINYVIAGMLLSRDSYCVWSWLCIWLIGFDWFNWLKR